MKTKIFTSLFILFALLGNGSNVFGQAIGDYVATTSGSYETAANWSISNGSGGYSGVASSVPTTAINVWIPQGKVMTTTGTVALNAKDLHILGELNIGSNIASFNLGTTSVGGNLYISSTGKFRNSFYKVVTNLSNLYVYGTTITIDGQLGASSASSADDFLAYSSAPVLNTSSLTGGGAIRIFCQAVGSGGNAATTTLSGSGVCNITRLIGTNSTAGSAPQIIDIDIDINLMNNGSAAAEVLTLGGNNGGSDRTLNILSGRKVAYVGGIAASGLHRGTIAGSTYTSGNLNYNVYGTLDMGNGSIHLTTSSKSGVTKDAKLNVMNGGTLVVGSSLDLWLGLATGQTCALVVADGATVKFGQSSASATTFSNNAGAAIASYPSVFTNLILDNSYGLTYPSNLTINGTLTLTAGTLTTGANTLTLMGTTTGSGTIETSTTGTIVYGGLSAQTISNLASNAVNSLTIDNAAGVNLNGNIAAGTLTINASKILNVNAGKQLTVSTTMSNAGTLNLRTTTDGGTGSLTATIITPSTITQTSGVSNVEQYLGTARNWYVSSPVVSTASTTTDMSKYFEYVEAGTNDPTGQPTNSTAFWKGYTPETLTMTAGQGYIALPSTTGVSLSFSGKLNTDVVSVPISSAGTRFNLIGNPYPCHIAWTPAYATSKSAQIESSIYIRTNSGGSNSGGWSFATYNASTQLAVPTHSLLAGGIIPPMQAFWVKAVASAASPLVLTSDLTRSHQVSNPLKAPALKNSEHQLVRLEVSNGTRTDETLLLFDANATDGYDAYDSPKYMEANSEVQIYTTIESQKLVMNGMKNLPLDKEISLGFIPGNATSFSIKANEISNLPSDVKVILKDNVTMAETDLTDGSASYQFSPETTSSDRFSVIFRSPGAVTGLNNNNDKSTMVYWNNNQGLTLRTNDEKLIGSTVSVYNAVGQQLLSKTITGTSMNIDFHYTPNVYIVKVNNVSTKVIVK